MVFPRDLSFGGLISKPRRLPLKYSRLSLYLLLCFSDKIARRLQFLNQTSMISMKEVHRRLPSLIRRPRLELHQTPLQQPRRQAQILQSWLLGLLDILLAQECSQYLIEFPQRLLLLLQRPVLFRVDLSCLIMQVK